MNQSSSLPLFLPLAVRLPKKAAPTTRPWVSRSGREGDAFQMPASDEALQRLKEELAANDEAKCQRFLTFRFARVVRVVFQGSAQQTHNWLHVVWV